MERTTTTTVKPLVLFTGQDALNALAMIESLNMPESAFIGDDEDYEDDDAYDDRDADWEPNDPPGWEGGFADNH